jgi:predicted nucleic acid-binding protein
VPIAAVVADANVLLSAVVGKAALRVFSDFALTVHVARFTVDEVAEYLPAMAAQYRLPGELVAIQWKLLPVTIHERAEYARCFRQAEADLAQRDPEDAHALALARCLRLPLWSNDRDFERLRVACYPTARLLAALVREQRTER